eukprot:157617-Prymnesium_polylepis.2
MCHTLSTLDVTTPSGFGRDIRRSHAVTVAQTDIPNRLHPGTAAAPPQPRRQTPPGMRGGHLEPPLPLRPSSGRRRPRSFAASDRSNAPRSL